MTRSCKKTFHVSHYCPRLCNIIYRLIPSHPIKPFYLCPSNWRLGVMEHQRGVFGFVSAQEIWMNDFPLVRCFVWRNDGMSYDSVSTFLSSSFSSWGTGFWPGPVWASRVDDQLLDTGCTERALKHPQVCAPTVPADEYEATRIFFHSELLVCWSNF